MTTTTAAYTAYVDAANIHAIAASRYDAAATTLRAAYTYPEGSPDFRLLIDETWAYAKAALGATDTALAASEATGTRTPAIARLEAAYDGEWATLAAIHRAAVAEYNAEAVARFRLGLRP